MPRPLLPSAFTLRASVGTLFPWHPRPVCVCLPNWTVGFRRAGSIQIAGCRSAYRYPVEEPKLLGTLCNVDQPGGILNAHSPLTRGI